MDYIHEIIKRYLKNRYPQNLETKSNNGFVRTNFQKIRIKPCFSVGMK